jgi:PadR family transcriptional regulator PadR
MTKINTQMLKGLLEGAMLLVISQGATYGYEINAKLQTFGFTTVAAGTIYPLLQKLEKNSWIVGDMRPSPDGPPRKYLTITALGEERLVNFLEEWEIAQTALNHLIEKTQGEKDEND